MADNYLSFDRKYRPASLDEYIGNKFLIETIVTALRENKLSKSILLIGTRGTGKTSLARLIAKELLCKNKIDGRVCGTCSMCIRITEEYIKQGKEIPGIREVNTSNTNSKEDIVNLIKLAKQRPAGINRLVLIMDEVHRMTEAAQDAFLKFLEEPPDHLYLILCTTDPDRLLPTIKSRCVIYKVKKPTIQELVDRLEYICRKENIQYDRRALSIIANKKSRIPREAIKALEEIAKANVKVDLRAVYQYFDIIDTEIYIEFFDLLNKERHDIPDIIEFVDKLDNQSIDIRQFAEGLIEFIQDAINIIYGIKLEEYSEEYYKNIRKIFAGYKSENKEIIRIFEYARKFYNEVKTDEFIGKTALITLMIKLSRPEMFEPFDFEENKKQLEKERERANEAHKNKIVQNLIDKNIVIKLSDGYVENKSSLYGDIKDSIIEMTLNIFESSADLSLLSDDTVKVLSNLCK